MTKTGKKVLVFLAGFVIACVVLVIATSSGLSTNIRHGELYTGTTDEFEGLVHSGEDTTDSDVMELPFTEMLDIQTSCPKMVDPCNKSASMRSSLFMYTDHVWNEDKISRMCYKMLSTSNFF